MSSHLEFQGDFLGQHLLLFRQTDQLAIGDASREIFEFIGSADYRLLDGGKIQ